jgi:hypothetical protein
VWVKKLKKKTMGKEEEKGKKQKKINKNTKRTK